MTDAADSKADLRQRLRAARRAHVAELPPSGRALLLLRPPRAIAESIDASATIGVYAETAEEAPASGYARWFFDAGHSVALPWFAHRGAAMEFRVWRNPHDPDLIERGPLGIAQPAGDPPAAVPDVLFVPLVGFTAAGARLGMGAGHYDRWLAAHPGVTAIGLAWDCQEAAELPTEPHDHPLAAVITPTRLFGPFGGAPRQSSPR